MASTGEAWRLGRRPALDEASGRIDVLDYLRLAAALTVLIYHYSYKGIVGGFVPDLHLTAITAATKYGYLGVDLFFIISGFVILNSARGKSAKSFAVGRATRLFPAFWAGLLLTTLTVTIWGHLVGLEVTPTQFVGNLGMAPELVHVAPVDRSYWSLMFELRFYGLVWLLLCCGQRDRLPSWLAGWGVVSLVAAVLAPSAVPETWFGGYFALFVSGAMLAEIGAHGVRLVPVVGLVTSAALAIPAAGWKAAEIAVIEGPTGPDPLVAMGVVVGCYLAVGLLCLRRVAGARLRGARWAGGVTYPLYLVHGQIGYIVLTGTDGLPAWLRYLTALTVAGTLAVLVHAFVERRLTGYWRRSFSNVADMMVQLGPRARSGRRERPVEAVELALGQRAVERHDLVDVAQER